MSRKARKIETGDNDLWIVSDEHYGHYNMIAMCSRPWTTVDEMTEGLIGRHNAVVGENDITIHIGDFVWKTVKFDDIVYQLNGYHIFVRGNHDKAYPSVEHASKHRAKYEILENQIFEFEHRGHRFVACHYPFFPKEWNGAYRGVRHFYGHVHRRLLAVDAEGGYHVGVDTNNWEPVNVGGCI